MPLIQLLTRTSHWGLVLGYMLLVLTLQPLLLEHAFAAGTTHEHSDQDVCTWLDHAASAGLQSVTPSPVLIPVIVTPPPIVEVAFRRISRLFDSVRGPPPFVS